jgi:hypothetical protein
MGAGALAALAVVGAGLAELPTSGAETGGAVDAGKQTAEVKVVERPVRYVRLEPGQKAPKGARVIREAAPTPRVVVRRVRVSAPSQVQRNVARTRQSGR